MKNEKKATLSTLWDNDMVRSAVNSLSDEDKERYKKIGESMFKDIDFDSSQVIDSNNNNPPFLSDATAYILESIKSGLHPSMLAENEKIILNEVLGKDWYKKYGYVEEDLTEIVTLKQKETENNS